MILARQVVLCVLIAAMTLCAWFVPLDSTANQQIDAGLKRALITFAAARTLNAIISVAQGTEFAVQPLGVGVKLSLGQILHPVNNLVEQFAHLMLVASIAFGIEKILISMGAHWLISLALTTAAIGWSYCYLRHHFSPAWLSRILVVLLMTRFGIPIVIIGSDMLFHQFMTAEYSASQKVIETTSGQLNSLGTEGSTTDGQQNIMDKLKGMIPSTPTLSDIKSRFENLKQAVEQTTERVIQLMVIFLLQTLLLPIFLAWVLWGLAKGTFEIPTKAAHLISRSSIKGPVGT